MIEKSRLSNPVDQLLSVLVLSVGASLPACSGYDPSATAGSDENASTVEQAYSDDECKTAAADQIGTISTIPGGFTGTTPQTYSNRNAFKSFIWDVLYNTAGGEVYPYLSLNPSLLNPADYDTQAECEALSFNRRLYRKNSLSGGLTMYAEGFAHGVWDPDFACQLPRYWGPFLKFPNALPFGGAVRVCVSARKADGSTVGVRANITDTRGISSEQFVNPRIKVGSNFYPVIANDTSGLAYCLRRKEVSLAVGSTAGSCTTSFVEFNTLLHAWRVAATAGRCERVWTSLECEPPVSPAL